jgi:UDP-N-acetylglucosamine--N-acetylmuramyl-(pentapeptide) pyrophosphoryl-undecaprenol N-acetylglucosamine transferase
MSAPLVVLAAGGTGGHVFPAEALATKLSERGLRLALVTDRRGTNYGGVLGNIETHRLRVSQLSGGVAQKLQGVVDLGLSLFEARRLLSRLAPRVAVGFGGYPSLPTMLAATRGGIPTLVHEQNAVLGRANRWVGGKVSAIATSFPQVRFLPSEAQANARLTGNPVRAGIIALRGAAYSGPLPNEPIRVLITGGSQGAAIFSSVIPAAIAALPPEQRARLSITQQCRPEDIEAVRKTYAGLDVTTELATFFADLPQRLANAQLVICRSGASTIAELTCVGRPAILVPYALAMDDHQTANALYLADNNAAWRMTEAEFTPAALASRLMELIGDWAPLGRMAAASHKLGRPDAADRLADLVVQMATQERAA